MPTRLALRNKPYEFERRDLPWTRFDRSKFPTWVIPENVHAGPIVLFVGARCLGSFSIDCRMLPFDREPTAKEQVLVWKVVDENQIALANSDNMYLRVSPDEGSKNSCAFSASAIGAESLFIPERKGDSVRLRFSNKYLAVRGNTVVIADEGTPFIILQQYRAPQQTRGPKTDWLNLEEMVGGRLSAEERAILQSAANEGTLHETILILKEQRKSDTRC